MTRNVIFGTVFSAALAVGVAAQTTPPQTDPQTQRQPQQQGQQVTVQGCLQSADIAGGTAGTSGTGTSGTTGQQQQSRGGAQFMLTNAKITSGGTGTSGTTGTTGTTSTMADTKFKLMGGNQQELRQYVNSQVEIRGTIREERAPGSAGTSGSGTGSGYGTGSQQKEQTGMSDVKTLRVTSVKQISPNCSGGDR